MKKKTSLSEEDQALFRQLMTGTRKIAQDTIVHRPLRKKISEVPVKRLLQEQAEQDGGDEAAQQFDASFQLMMMTFAEFLPVLFEALGGEEIPQGV